MKLLTEICTYSYQITSRAKLFMLISQDKTNQKTYLHR